MVHKEVQHLLAQVYRGRLGADTPILAESKDGSSMLAAGGLTFAAIESHELELSRDQYLKQQAEDDWETGSMASSSALTSTPSKANLQDKSYFDEQRRQYMSQGPGGYPATPAESLYYDQPRGRNASVSSREDLLAHAAPLSQAQAYPPYAAAHSQASLQSYQDLPRMAASRSSVDLSAYTDPRESLRYSAVPDRSPQQQYPSPQSVYSPQQHYPSPQSVYSPQQHYSPRQSPPASRNVGAPHARNISADAQGSPQQQFWGSAPSYRTHEASYPPTASGRSSPAPSLPLGAQRSASPASNLTFGQGAPPGSPRQSPYGRQSRDSSMGSQGGQQQYWQQR
jgi:hypothetical protein